MKDYKQVVGDISEYVGHLRKLVPDALAGFNQMAKAASQGGALDEKTKELMLLGMGVAARCDGCIGFHTKALVRLKASREEVAEVLALAVYMGGGPSLMFAADALRAFDQFNQQQ